MRDGSRVLYASFDRVPAPKGASTHISQFVRGLSNRFEVSLLTPGAQAWEGETFGAAHRVVPIEGQNFLRDTETFAEAVHETLSREDYHVVHFRSIWEGMVATTLKASRGYKTVYEVNGLPSVELRYHYPSVVKAAPQADAGSPVAVPLLDRIRGMEMLALVESDLVIVPSRVTRAYLVGRGVAERKIEVIPNGVDTDLFKPPAVEPSAEGPLTVIYIGTLAPWQGVAHLLEGFKRATKSREMRPARDAKLVIVGKARKDWLKELVRRARKLKIADMVEFADPVRHREIPEVIGRAHIGAAPFLATERNTRQGFCPIKILEYMACGRPLVAPDIPAVGELCRHETEALLYKPNSMARLADALVRLMEDEGLRKKLGALGRKRALNFTWRAARDGLLNNYRDRL